jgi:RNA polymerase sigma-70 factor (ECF subfamily)
LEQLPAAQFPRPRLRLAFPAGRTKLSPVIAMETNWPASLRAPDNAAAVTELRVLLLSGLRAALGGRGDVSEAHLEDFAQDALVKILARLDDFQGRSKFTTWAHSIAINVAFAELRRKRWRDVSLDEFMENGKHFAEAVADAPAHGNDEEREHLIRALRRAVAEKLSDKQRAIIAAALAGQPFDQTVELLGTNRNAAYKLLHDARRALKAALLAEGVSEETIRHTFAA